MSGEYTIHIFETLRQGGKKSTLHDSNPDINPILPSGSHLGLSSFKVEKGEWEIFPETNYGGRPFELDGKTLFGPGEYDFLPKNVRHYSDKAQSIKLHKPPASIKLFSNWGFKGDEATLSASSSDISAQFPEGRKGLSSFIVHSGKWSFYTEADYNGKKVEDANGVSEFGPGEYELRGRGMKRYNDETVSIKLIE